MTLDIGFLAVSAATAMAVCLGVLMYRLVPPPRPLRGRIAPYLSPQGALARPAPGSSFAAVFGPIVRSAADAVGTMLDRRGAGELVLKIRQAGWYHGMDESEMVARYRMRQLGAITASLLVGVAVTRVVGATALMTGALGCLAAVVGATRTRARLDRDIEGRRQRMNIEIYTVNQLLAMRVRAGGGVVNGVNAIVSRGAGEVVAELEEALRLHRAGWPATDAFRRVAELTPDPFCARTYRLLATAEERGADLAGALLALSEDVREARREAIKRSATKRRAAMLVPTIAILAPVLILFVAAPLPYLITSWQ